MASIYKHTRGNTPFWICVFRDHTGKQRHRSTKAKERGAAEEVCQRMQREADLLAKSSRLENKGAVMESFVMATQQAEKNSFNEATARKMLNDILTASGHSPISNVTTRQYLTDWIASKTQAKADGTAKRYRHTIEAFIQHLGKKADSGLAAIVPKDIEKFRDIEVKEGKSPGTANMVIKTLRIPLNLARRQGLILTNPAEAVDFLESESGQKDDFNREQIISLLKAADWEWKGMILLAASCGLRIGDAARLTWANVDLEAKVIRYMPQKTAKGRKRKPLETVILPDLENYLTNWPGSSEHPGAPLFPSLSKKRVSGVNGLSLSFQAVMEKAEIFAAEDTRKVKGKGRRFHNLSFHSLRHSFISMMANTGVSKEIRMKLAGHSSNVHERYTHLELETLRSALALFPNLKDK